MEEQLHLENPKHGHVVFRLRDLLFVPTIFGRTHTLEMTSSIIEAEGKSINS